MKNFTKGLIVFALTVGILSTPILSFAKSNKGEEKREERKSERSENKCRSWGHFIAPGWSKGERGNLDNCKKIPWGIWKKYNKGNNDDQSDQTGDTSAPKILSLHTTNINEIDAEVIVYTNEKSIVKVDYGTTNTYGSSTTKTTDFKAFNVVKLTGLTANTTYHYKVTVEDKSGNTKTSGDRMLKTDAVVDATAPVISNVQVTAITNASATITWTTNENTDSKVEYGTTNTYGTNSTDASLVTNHSRVLTGLTQNTTYHYKITSKDSSNNTISSADATFKTLYTDQTDPIISNISVSAITQTGATVAWQTNEEATSTIYWSTVTPINELTAFKNIDAVLKTDNTYNITGLIANTTYYYKIVSTDASENVSSSSEGSIVTLN
jgi:hypothetical protein